MKKIKQIGFIVLGLSLVCALVPMSTYAQSATSNPISEQSCLVAKQKITTHLAVISDLQVKQSTKYASLEDQVNTLVSTATEAKYNGLSNLSAARDNATAALNIYSSQARVYTTALEAAQSAPCTKDGSEFALALESARTELVTLRSTIRIFKSSIKLKVVPALKDYAKWLKVSTDTRQEKL